MQAIFLLSFLFVSSNLQGSQCSICQMEVRETAKSSFESVRNNSPVRFCSFSCASRFHKKYPNAHLSAHDFEKPETKLDAESAFYLTKSKKLSSQLEFPMEPSVAAFNTKEAAEKKQRELKEGTVIKGFEALEKLHE